MNDRQFIIAWGIMFAIITIIMYFFLDVFASQIVAVATIIGITIMILKLRKDGKQSQISEDVR